MERQVVEEVLSMLRGAALEHYTAALTSYGKDTQAEHVRSAESLRRSLEEYLRDRLSNSRGLDQNIRELLSRLKKDGRDPVIRNLIFQTFTLLDKYFNENSKHADGEIDVAENEYLIYQTGVLIRYTERALGGKRA